MEAERYVSRVLVPRPRPDPRGARAIFGIRRALSLAFSIPRLTPSRPPQIDASETKASDETDTIEAFVALGGNADKTGEISTEKLRAVVKVRAR